ncbi:MAG: FecR domain-containing protein, partial [Bacteroidota bacterium]
QAELLSPQMESPNPQYIPWPLVAAALSGQADVSQLDELRVWREADLQHEQWYQKSLQIWENSQQFSFPDQFDSQEDWPKVAMQLDFQRPMLWRPYLLVASIILLFGLGFLLWLQRPQLQWQTITAKGDHQEILLSDGSKVVLREGSSLRFPDEFTGGRREVQLNGEAWFEVNKDPERGFVVDAPQLQVEVLGTVFVVRDASQDSLAEVDVIEGLVRVSAADSLRLSAGQSVRLEAGSLRRKVQNPQFAAWRQGELRFENASLSEVIESLERYYQVRLQSRGSPGEARLTARFTDESLSDALDIVQLIFEVEISQR